MSIKDLHIKAMELASDAFNRKNQGSDGAIEIFKQAFELEREVALTAHKENIGQPSISVLLRSAASLAINAELLNEAEKLICLALSGDLPFEIAEELRDLLETVNFDRHLKLKGVTLSSNEIQVSLAGNGVGLGMSKFENVSNRINVTEKLLIRTAERIAGRPFRSSGKTSKDLSHLWQSYMSIPRAASFAFTVRYGGVQGELFDDTSGIIDDVLENITLINNGDYEKLKTKIGDEIYLRNFVSLTKELAPDGDDISLIGITTIRNNTFVNTKLSTHRSKISAIGDSEGDVDLRKLKEKNKVSSVLEGTLIGAKKSQNSIWLKTSNEELKIIVPEGLDDIVRNYWDKEVRIRGYNKSKGFELLEII